MSRDRLSGDDGRRFGHPFESVAEGGEGHGGGEEGGHSPAGEDADEGAEAGEAEGECPGGRCRCISAWRGGGGGFQPAAGDE